ncbi:hypothetical protein [Ghiorsea bivora]|nr:hypothetical protein [Ghiorsea bivora]
MNSHLVPSVPKLCVVRLSNSRAITCDTRLDFEYAEQQSALFRRIQTFLK